MKAPTIQFHIWKPLAIVFVFARIAAVPAQQTDAPMPITSDHVPVTTAISTLARLAGINFLFSDSVTKPNGPLANHPPITINWTNLTPKQALERVLKEQSLYLVDDPVTTVYEITITNKIVDPVDASLLVSETNQVVPIVMQDVPLDQVLTTLIQYAHINATLDPKLVDSFATTNGPFKQVKTVSFRWETVTARQALIALCENYNLAVVKDPATGEIQIKPKN